MIGFEYICNLFNVPYVDIASMLDISKQTINSWTSGRRKIPKKYLPILSEKFKMPESYFQKEIDSIDKLEIQSLKIQNEKQDIKGNSIICGIEQDEFIEELFKFEGKYVNVNISGAINKLCQYDSFIIYDNYVDDNGEEWIQIGSEYDEGHDMSICLEAVYSFKMDNISGELTLIMDNNLIINIYHDDII